MRGSGSGFYLTEIMRRVQLHDLESRVRALGEAWEGESVRDRAARRIEAGSNLTRQEAAAYLGISVRQLSRLDASGRLARCAQLGRAVMYAARDVVRIASATRKER